MIVSYSPVLLAEIQVPILAGSAGAALTLIVRKCGFHFQWCRSPLLHHTHKNPVPRLGGIAVFTAIVAACLFGELRFGLRSFLPVLPILLAGIPVLLVGAYDDLRHASPKSKVLAQLAGAAVLLLAHSFHGPLPLTEWLLLPAWLVITTNSFNLIDGLDGLAAGSAVIIALGLAAINIAVGNLAVAAIAMIVAAACLGFLPFNFFARRIFLGDSGSLSIGFILAAIAFETPRVSTIPWTAMLLFGFPLTDTTLTIVRRALKGRSLFRPDREHLHHKLRHAGLSAVRSTGVLLLVALAFVSLGVMLGLGSSHWLCVGCGALLFLAVAKSFGYLRTRKLFLLHLRIAALRESRREDLPELAGYLPFK